MKSPSTYIRNVAKKSLPITSRHESHASKSPSGALTWGSCRRGFTLIEIILVIAIITILGSFGLVVGMDAYRGYSYRSERNVFVSALQKARIAAMTNINEAKHGVHVDAAAKTYTIFQGNDYGTRTQALDQVITASGAVTFSGVTDVVFDQLSGMTTAGTVTIADGVRTTVISLNNEGQISW
jgi:prepilin-type N-terminal cleavage/methylation domain-containing protein